MKKQLLLLSSAMLLASANVYAQNKPAADADYDVHEVSDPLEGFNRAMFTFNYYYMDRYVLKPAAKGYRAITTQDIRNRVNSALANLKEPISAVNYLLQGELQNSATSVGRFLVNSTLGLAGTFDVATGWGWGLEKTTLDNTLAKYCVPDGPFMVLPFIGSTSPRTLAANVADNFAHPAYWATKEHDDGMLAYAGFIAFQTVAWRETTIEFSDDLERDSVDLYATMRSAYLQNKNKINCGGKPTYDFDFDNE